ncbi:ABC transporter permease [Streptomyces armeniacus]|uniref:ABC transporter permease n=1 Tax=Streptomyces armeniacus TaxID=83291 RepID=A0A345XLG7_9ACTN|nr:ABC transporter permease [Streptomyces armeniacus]AXK32483.1 ABC transporter permease [Streptomyces armeniacus]
MTTTTEKARSRQGAGAGARKTSAAPLHLVQSKAFVHAAQVLICVAFLVLWETASSQGWADRNLYGQPSGIWTAIVDYLPSEKGLSSLRATAAAVAVSFVVGSVAGTVAGLVLGLSPTLNAIFGPFLAPINSVPRIALAPLFIAWFGLTMTSKVVLAVSMVFFILAENARSTVRSVDSDLMTMARVVGLKRVSLLTKVVLPSAVPTMFAGLRLTFTYALLGVVASEMVAATGGLGQEIVLYSSSYQINTVFAILVELMVIAVAMNWLFTAAEKRLLVWQQTS